MGAGSDSLGSAAFGARAAVEIPQRRLAVLQALGGHAQRGGGLAPLVFPALKDLLALIAGGLAAGFACSLALMTFVCTLLFGIRHM